MLKIWGRANSINVQKVLWCCGELGITYDRIDAGMEFGVNNTPEYRAMNPNGLVPTINDDGFILWESHAIVRYLARKHSLGTLCPGDPKACADADRWMDWNLSVLTPNVRIVFWNLVRIAPEKRDMALVDAARDKLAASLTLLDAHLAGRRYVTGDAFSMGDIPIGTSVQRWFNVPIKREPLPNLEAYYRRLQQRAAFKKFADLLPLT